MRMGIVTSLTPSQEGHPVARLSELLGHAVNFVYNCWDHIVVLDGMAGCAIVTGQVVPSPDARRPCKVVCATGARHRLGIVRKSDQSAQASWRKVSGPISDEAERGNGSSASTESTVRVTPKISVRFRPRYTLIS